MLQFLVLLMFMVLPLTPTKPFGGGAASSGTPSPAKRQKNPKYVLLKLSASTDRKMLFLRPVFTTPNGERIKVSDCAEYGVSADFERHGEKFRSLFKQEQGIGYILQNDHSFVFATPLWDNLDCLHYQVRLPSAAPSTSIENYCNSTLIHCTLI